MFAIETTQLTRHFDKKIAVNNLDLQVAEGEFFGFLGPNGAGKSTTINMIVGLLAPTSGTVKIQGIDMWQNPLQAKAMIGVLPEGLNLYERLKAREYIEFAGTMHGLTPQQVSERTTELLELMDIADAGDKMIVDFSTGMRKKTALAAAIIHAPRVLFLDEPFEGIDAISGRAIRNVLQQLRERGTTIFFTSHILEVVERLCTRMGVIADGQLVAEGSIAELRQRAMAGEAATLEEVFLKTVGANESEDKPKERLSWIG